MAKINPGKNATKRDAITEKASVLFKTKGYSSASMRELAEAVGVEAPSLYNHIGSKIELLQSICFRVAGEFTSFLDSEEKNPVNNARKIENIIRFHIGMMLNNFDAVFVANHEWKHLKEPHLTHFLDQRRNYEKRLVALIESGIKAGEFKNINPYITILTILSAVRGLEFWQHYKKHINIQVPENDMVNHLLTGIVK